MQRTIAAAVGGALAAAGITILVLWLTGTAWPSPEVSASFCGSLEEWHAKYDAFLERMDEPGARTQPGIRETYDMFDDVTRIVLPEAGGEQERGLRDLLREAVSVAAARLSALGLYDSVKESAASTYQQRVSVFENAEEKRLESGDLSREASAQLQQVCGLPPLHIYG